MKAPSKSGRRHFNSTLGAVLVALFSPLLVSHVLAECVAPPAGLVSWWRGETNALDHAGTNHGTLAGNVAYASGRVGQGFVFDGNGAVVQLGNPASLHLQDFTIETWLRRTSPSVVSFNGGPGIGVVFGYDNGGYGLYLDPSGTPALSKIGFNEVKPAFAITDTNWHHLAVTKVGSTVVFYVDGVAYPAAAYDPGFTFSGNAYVGGLGSFYTFYGTVDEVSIYGRALATNEVQEIYHAGSAGKCVAVAPPCAPALAGLVGWWRGETNALDQAGTNNGTLAGNMTFTAGRVGQGFVFDGSGAVVQLGNPASLHFQDLTIETWIRRASTAVTSLDGNGNGVIFGYNIGGYGIYLDPSGTPALSKIGINEVKPGVTITDTNWHHLAVTKVGSTVVFYVDGVAYSVAAYDPGFTFSENAFIGGLAGNYTFFGAVDEVSVYNRALATNEIQAVYVAGGNGKCVQAPPPSCTPTPAGLVSWWRGEVNALDQAGINNGTLAGDTTFTSGRVGQGFVFDGNGASVELGNPASLHFQDLTIETWIRRASTAVASLNGNGNGHVFGYSIGGYGLYLDPSGIPALSKIGFNEVKPDASITDTNWHHLAVTKVGSTVVFYVDGVAYPAGAYDPGFTFSENAFIGGLGNNYSFYGAVDEVSVYSRSLSAPEIQAVFNVGSSGKCLTGTLPSITAQPAVQTVTVGETATFSVTASGTAPLDYQWRLNSTNIAGATDDSLVLTNVQLAAAGVYSVVVSNSFGMAISSNASLTVNTLVACANPPSGLVSWWRGEANALDQVGGSSGSLAGTTTYGVGRVSQAFVFDGNGATVQLGNPASLHFQDLTIETWIRRASTAVVSLNGNGNGHVFGYSIGGYGLYLDPNGTPTLSKIGFNEVKPGATIADTNWHHLAVTKVGSAVVFYVDGVAYPAGAYDPGFTFSENAFIGGLGNNYSFYGAVDEVSVYNRPLSASEIQGIVAAGSAGKCLVSFPAFIVTQPANKTAVIGADVTLSVTAGGTPPFSYQWRYNGASITNATNATLTLTNVQSNQAGNYAVEVANASSPVPVLSSNATLTVTYPAANVRLVGTNIVSGRPVTLPIQITANGNENAVSFSLNYTTSRLSFRSAQLGDFPPGTYFFVNTSQTNLGRLGLTVALPSGATFAAGTQLLAGVTFDATISLAVSPVITQVGFGDSPMPRGLTDVNALTLPATYTGGTVTLSGTDLEGDAFPRPGGSRSFTVNDWVQAGRFAAKLDLPATDGEFQRADSAPRGAQGDGQIKVMDWVQAGLYFAGSNPLTAVGGPTVEVAPTGPLGPDALREVRVAGTNAIQDLAVTLPVTLQSQGNENGVGFTVSFDPAAFIFQAANLGSGAAGANFNLNTNQIAAGKLGLALVLPTGSSFAAGTRELVQVNLLATTVGSHPVSLTDQLVLRGVSDPAATELPASYVTGTVVVNPHPTLLITRVGTNVAVSWPALASGFNLQASTNATLPGGWGDVLDVPQAEGDMLKVTLPVTDQTEYFRLRYP